MVCDATPAGHDQGMQIFDVDFHTQADGAVQAAGIGLVGERVDCTDGTITRAGQIVAVGDGKVSVRVTWPD